MNKCHHTKCPAGYLDWHEWSKEKAKTHKQVQCGICGLWAVWKPKKTSTTHYK